MWDTRHSLAPADVLSSVDAFPTRCSIKVEREFFEELIEGDNFIQAPYIAKNQWVQIQDIEQVKELVENSYNLIKSKLTKKLQKEIHLLD